MKPLFINLLLIKKLINVSPVSINIIEKLNFKNEINNFLKSSVDLSFSYNKTLTLFFFYHFIFDLSFLVVQI